MLDMASTSKCKLWSNVSMSAAVDSVLKETRCLWGASCLYNVPIENLQRRVNGSVVLSCRPGPPTVLTEEEEEKLPEYFIQMADMGFGTLYIKRRGYGYGIYYCYSRPT